MKLLVFDNYQIGLLRGEAVVDVTDLVTPYWPGERERLMNALISNFDDLRPQLERALEEAPGMPLSDVTLRPPLPRPASIDCMAVNYMEDGTREAPAPINGFHKAPTAVIGPGETMVLPDVPAEIFEGEAELALVIGRSCHQVPATEARDYIFGYMNFIDGSARALPPAGNTFYQVKSRDSFAPIGPYIVTADEVADPQNLAIKLWVNGNLMQDFNSDDMAHSIDRCVEWVSSIHRLEPGAILATGTNHRGLSAFQDGDKIDLECEGLGRLSISVRDNLRRSWSRDTRLQHSDKGLAGRYTPQVSGKYAPGE